MKKANPTVSFSETTDSASVNIFPSKEEILSIISRQQISWGKKKDGEARTFCSYHITEGLKADILNEI